MANALYDWGREGFLGGDIDWNTATIKCCLVDTTAGGYVLNLDTHQFMSSVTGIVATSPALSGKTITDGIANAAAVTFSAVTGVQAEAIVIFQSSAVTGGADVAAGAQRLIAYIDAATGLPVTPNGGDITVTWDTGTNKIFKL